MKKKDSLTIVHLILMAALVLFNGFAVFMYFSGNGLYGVSKLEMLLRGFFSIFTIIALIIGILYVLNAYGKKAANYYKAFLLVQAFETLLLFFFLVFNEQAVLSVLLLIATAGKILILLVLALWKDLGKKKTVILFLVLVGLEIAASVLLFFYHPSPSLIPYKIIGVISRLVMLGAVGLAIRGKYKDKESRGTK